MKKGVTRRTFLKSAFQTLLAVIGLGSGGLFYAHNIEPALIDLKCLEIKHRLIPKDFDGIEILQFSDTHIGFQYSLKQLEKLIMKINALHPDIVLFTGDLIDAPDRYNESDRIVSLLKQINAPLGKYSIYGNHDHGGYGTELYKHIMEESQFKLLKNKAVPVELSDTSRIYLLGLDDAMLGKPNFLMVQKYVPDHAFKILLSHAPDLADKAAQYNIQWQLSGHSHGGQVKLPFVGALIIPPYAKKYPEGHYMIGETNPLHLYVNRGLGTTRLPFRFKAKPELTLFTLRPIK